MILISAMSSDRVIGCKGGLPWNVPAEYNQYLDFVCGNTVIMGRRTFDVFGSDLSPDTDCIVVSRSRSLMNTRHTVTNIGHIAPTFHDAIEIGRTTAKPLFVAGGSTIYEQAMPHAQKIYLSTIKGNYRGDAYFPKLDFSKWTVVTEQEHEEFVFRIYQRTESLAQN